MLGAMRKPGPVGRAWLPAMLIAAAATVLGCTTDELPRRPQPASLWSGPMYSGTFMVLLGPMLAQTWWWKLMFKGRLS